MKKYLLILLAVLALPSVMALELEVDEISSNNVVVESLEKPATFMLNITNLGSEEELRISAPVGSRQEPETFDWEAIGEIDKGESKAIELKLYPPIIGTKSFEYYLINRKGEQHAGRLRIERKDIEEIFEIGSGKIYPKRNVAEIYIENTMDTGFENVDAEFSSPFFSMEKSFSIGPNERKVFEKKLDKEEFEKLRAGFYTLDAKISLQGEEFLAQGTIEFQKEKKVETKNKSSGFLIKTNVIEKSNKGNVEERVKAKIQKDLIPRIFTSTSPSPDVVEKEGSKSYYVWDRNLAPGESFEARATTNWVWPLIIIVLIVVAAALIKRYMQNDLKIKKKTKFVKSKGEEFALRVDVFVEARRPVENVSIIESVPPLLKLYEKFGKEEPKKIDENKKKLEWEFGSLEPGEKRILSYVVYSKVKVVGKFALPKTKGVYERDGKVKESSSNRVYFVSEKGRDKNE